MQSNHVSKLQSRKRRSRRLAAESLESRQLMAADIGMMGSPEIRSAMLSRIQNSGMDASAIVSQFRSSGMSTQQLMAMRQQIAGNPAAQAIVQQRLQDVLVPTDQASDSVANEVPATEPMSSVTTQVAADEPEPVTTEPVQQDDSPSGMSLRDSVRERVETRVGDRFDAELPALLQERVSERRERGIDGRPGGPLSRLRAVADRVEIDPSEFVVRAEDGSIDREATRENVRERLGNSDLAESLRDRVSGRFDGEIPERLQERLSPNTAHLALGFPPVSSLGRHDVNRDGALSPMDALSVVNVLNDPDTDYDELADVNGDGQVSPIDALQVINAINERFATPSAIVTPIRAAAADHVFAGDFDSADDEEDERIFLV